MTEPLLTISAFARAVDLPSSTLRYYDELGLLPPTEVDGQTGYRYYTPRLERRARMIRRMREVGVGIDTMRRVLDGPAEQAAEILRGFAERANETARRTTSAMADVVAGLHAEAAVPGPVVVSVDGPELASSLRRVSAAASADSDSPLGVVLLDVTDSELTVVATDRYWLATQSISLRDVHVGQRRIVVPARAAEDFAGWLVRQDVVTISTTADDIRVMGTEDGYALLTTVDRFPAYRLVLDGQPPARGRVALDRAQLRSAVSNAGSWAMLRVGQDRVAVWSQGASEGAHLGATSAGEPITLGFSVPLLESALMTMVGTQVTLSYTAFDRAVRLSSADQRNVTVLAMPAKVDA